MFRLRETGGIKTSLKNTNPRGYTRAHWLFYHVGNVNIEGVPKFSTDSRNICRLSSRGCGREGVMPNFGTNNKSSKIALDITYILLIFTPLGTWLLEVPAQSVTKSHAPCNPNEFFERVFSVFFWFFRVSCWQTTKTEKEEDPKIPKILQTQEIRAVDYGCNDDDCFYYFQQ